ncbi:PRD domain-containing protein [Vagococcus xieshaowenii]|uniref:PRD domain-containing protein n=1 Tax=Vagococcus xieshaowenii TaxID=2562451 RepID=A0AAJ5JLR1_9ENTE|nr:PRD domain-containing protein [Vagococcus xieshaowenii]QCA28872.1 PRD domain-containing protein [Vagococcus xieshaowenii]TFZ43289.1 PRD domain-containing protein [Vagococcus xieshaowenii]
MIKQKLEILVSTDVISKETQDYSLEVLEYLLNKEIIKESAEAEVFLTHLAMADARRVKNEAVASLDEFIISDIMMNPKYEKAKVIWSELEKINGNEFEESELDYFYLHIINILKED